MTREADSHFVAFDAIVGQDRAVSSLRRELETDRVHHAHLFSGPEGVGKRRTALAWATRLLCARPLGSAACGACPSCLKLKAGMHPDLILVEPDGRSIKIEQVRAVTAATLYQPNEGRWRVIIIEQSELFGEAAANALLKTLEEPGGSTVFVLLSASPHRLLTTVRSRCLPVPFGPLTVDDTMTVLREHGLEGERAAALARLSRGAPGLALQLDGSQVVEERAETLDRWRLLARGELFDAMEWASRMAAKDQKDLLPERFASWIALLRDAAVLASTGRIDLVHNQDVARELTSLQRDVGLTTLHTWVAAIERAMDRVHGNVNARLITESLVLEMLHAAQQIESHAR